MGAGMGKDGARDIHNEFQMHHEDFPALPGTDGATSAGQLLNRQEDSNNLTRGFSLAFEKEKNRVVSGDVRVNSQSQLCCDIEFICA